METTYPGCREIVERAYRLKNMPEDSIAVILASICEKTLKQYDSALRKWWNFYLSHKLSPFLPDIPNIVKFLSDEFVNGAKYGTLNSVRSAISLIVGPEIADDFRVKRFFKGVYNMRPNKPKYDFTWDPHTVPTFYSKQPDNKDLSLKDISKKLLTLLALITAHRMQTFSLIELDNIDLQEEKIIIKIPKRIKTSGLNKCQPAPIIPFFKTNCKVCAASALVSYLEKTREIRGAEKRLFISFKSPHKAVTPQTLSHWVVDSLSAAGIDTSVYSAHSTRHASTSAANRQGVSIDIIRKTAGWSESSFTFAKFYNKEISQNREEFANAIYTCAEN